MDMSKIALTDMTGLIYPAIWINLTLALEMGWFEEDEDEDDSQFGYKLGPNLSIQLNGYEIPSTTDIISFLTASGGVQHVAYSDKYWIRPQWADGSFMDTTRISLDVSWRFLNLDYAFNNVSNHTSRPLYVYSDVGSSNVLGDQITDFIRAINFRREGRGSYFYEPAHLPYMPLRKEVLDILQVQIAETILTVSMNAFHSTNLFCCFSRYQASANSVAPPSVYTPHTTHNSSIHSDEGLTLETSAFESLYGG